MVLKIFFNISYCYSVNLPIMMNVVIILVSFLSGVLNYFFHWLS